MNVQMNVKIMGNFSGFYLKIMGKSNLLKIMGIFKRKIMFLLICQKNNGNFYFYLQEIMGILEIN
jgi:S-ribosylhomocysteine lyase LuxS involved in autoinducer biosynthesis